LNKKDETYMKMAMELAEGGIGFVNPNPLVGAVIVKDDRIIGAGFHEEYGHPHAERNALAACTEDPAGSTIYVTLEPCCHYGKNPPCTDAIIEAGIARVVIGSRDPNPLVAGKGVKLLRQAGIEVIEDFMKEECDAFNDIFFHYITKNRPFVTLKYAMTMDGKIATVSGKSQWISCEASRQHAHRERARNMAIMVGVGTVLADDPLLTARYGNQPDPIRIICDSGLRTPLSAQVITTAGEQSYRAPRTMIATCVKDKDRFLPYESAGAEVIAVEPDEAGKVDLCSLMDILGQRKIDSILMEGGGALSWSALNAGIVSRVQAYIAPEIFGGAAAISPVGGPGVDSPDQAFRLQNRRLTEIGEDYLIESEVVPCSQG
jgi:diaminohydroxyphosphoribosylaminopyrimidine deaminase/5-amino-6-(5-phosphoribosylamino)uracil reductase